VRQVISEIQEEAVGKYPDGDETELLVNNQSGDQPPAQSVNDPPSRKTSRNDTDHHISFKNVIDTPAFTAHQGNHYAGSALSILDEESSNAARDLPQWLDTDPVVDDTPPVPIYDPQGDEAEAVDRTAIDSLIRETPTWDVELPPATYRDDNQQSRSPTTQPARDNQKNSAVQSRNRSSGLLDKELKYLSSLQDSSSNGNGAAQSPARQEPVPKPSGPSKVIIDDSIYDVYGVRKPEPEDKHSQLYNFAEPEKHFWHKMFIAIIALAIIAVPIRAWYHRHSDAADRATAPASQPPVALNPVTKNAVTAKELAKSADATGSNTANKVTRNTANSSDKASAPATQAEANQPLPTSKPEPALANGPTVIPGTGKPPVQASVIKQPGDDTNSDSPPAAAASADKPTASHFAAFENNAVPSQPMQQSAQPESKTDKNAQSQGTTDSHKVKKNSVTKSSGNKSDAQPTSTVSDTKPATAQAAPVIIPVRPYRLHNDRVIQVDPVANASHEKNTVSAAGNINAATDPSSTAGITPASRAQRDSLDATTTVAKIGNDMTTSLSSNDRNIRSRPLKPAISLSDLATVVATLSNAYESGNLPQLVSIFANDIQNGDGENRDQLQDEYRQLFDITDKRRLIINNVAWSARNQQMLGKGDFQLIIREKGATKLTLYAGQIRLAVAREPRGVVIKKLDYDYNQ
jgi:hypothetical protein